MNRDQARALVSQTFTQAFDKTRFRNFAVNLLNDFDESKAFASNSTYVKDAFKDHVQRYERLGTYTSPDKEKLDVLIVHLTAESKLERARTAIRNFVADHLKTRDEKDAALVAFVSPTEQQWRFSYVKMEYATVEKESGKVGVETRLTPARRFSYLVGEGESCHTAQTRFLKLLQDTETNPKLADIEDAFSVEAVTREFFTKYAELFGDINAALEKLVKKDTAIRDEFEKNSVSTVDFAKKLMGQIVFLYFIQKKGWLGVAKGQDWGSGPRDFLRRLASAGGYDNFFNDVLEPLFYDTLATDRGHEAWCSRFQSRIPFLNGGLFEPFGDYNWRKTDILIPNRLFTNTEPVEEGITGTGVLDVFDRYNFTVNEAEPLEKEVAIDPEMLGKVFENLIEENRRKGLGSFYTPREIVHYMCQESLINYLDTAVNGSHDVGRDGPPGRPNPKDGAPSGRALPLVPRADIETFIHLGEQISHYEAVETKYARIKMPKSIEQHAKLIDEALANITVCDPAVGSGAYPVGMMTEIVRARSALTPYFNDVHERTPYHFKRHAIQNCLYGVDIDPGAIEIAKLRLWLSLVVDEEETKQIKPLPNLDYKIMQGNSLLDEFQGVRLLDDQLFQAPDDARKTQMAGLKTRISALQAQAIRLHGEGKKGAAQKLSAELDIKRLKKQLDSLLNPSAGGAQGELTQQTSWAGLKRIQELHARFFDENSRAEKDRLRRQLDELEWNFMEATLRERGHDEAIADLKRASASQRKPFFLWRLHFAEVFQHCGGFDVVIANPPYVRQEKIKELKPALKAERYECYDGVADLLVYFYERGVKLLRGGGTIALITSNKFYRAGYGEKLRGFLARELTLHRLIDFGDAPVFEAIAYASILTGLRTKPTPETSALAYTWEKEMTFERIAQIVPERGQQIRQSELKPDGWRLESPGVLRLLEKLHRLGKPLREFVGARVSRGLTTGLNEAFVVDRATRDRLICEHKSSAAILKPYIRGKDIDRWRAELSDQFVVKIESSENKDHPWSGKSKKEAEESFAKTYPAIYSHFENLRGELIKRDDQGKYFWEQRSCKYWQEFEKPKIVSTKISIRPTFALDLERRYLGNTA